MVPNVERELIKQSLQDSFRHNSLSTLSQIYTGCIVECPFMVTYGNVTMPSHNKVWRIHQTATIIFLHWLSEVSVMPRSWRCLVLPRQIVTLLSGNIFMIIPVLEVLSETVDTVTGISSVPGFGVQKRQGAEATRCRSHKVYTGYF